VSLVRPDSVTCGVEESMESVWDLFLAPVGLGLWSVRFELFSRG
jgi:hypothetical protein